MKKLLSVILALAMIFSLSIPAFAADNDPVWSVEYDKSAKAVVVTVDGVTEKFTNWKNNQAEEYTVNDQIISVTVKGNAIDKKAFIGPATAPVEPLAAETASDSNTTPSNSQIVVDAETRIWQDGFGFHCNSNGGNGATDVINLIDGKTVKKGDQKDVFGTKSFPITLVRVGTTTLWNLKTDDIKCATCGSTEWVTYSNNSGVINGKNIQAHHPAYTLINKTWTDGNPNDKEAIFDIYKYDSNKDDGRGVLVVEGALPGVKYQLEPGTYVVSEHVKEGYKVQPDQRLTVEEGKTTTFNFVNEPERVIVDTTAMFLSKYLKIGDVIVEWNDTHPFWADNFYIYFDLYESNEAGDKGNYRGFGRIEQRLADGAFGVEFDGLTVGDWYLVEERIDFDKAVTEGYEFLDRLNKYETPLPSVLFQAKENAEDLEFDFNPGDITETGINTLKNVIISTDLDQDLISASGELVAFDDAVMWEYNGETPVVPFWKGYMTNYNNGTNFFVTLDNIWLDDAGEIRPQFIWNTNDFTDKDLAQSGDVEVFTKTFNVLDTLTDENYDLLDGSAEIPFYITGDNAFIVFVNGTYVGKSDAILHSGTDITLDNYEDIIGDLGPGYLYAIPMDTWAKVYNFDIKSALILGGKNAITIVAINAADDGNQNYYDQPMRNPSGFIFGCEIYSISENYRFVNELPEDRDPVGNVSVTAEVEMFNIMENYTPVYEPIYDGCSESTLVSVGFNQGNYTGDTGGLNNWQTFVVVDVAAARENAIEFEVAKSGSGKHGFTGIGYNYYVAIENDQLIVTFPDNLVKANYGAIIVNDPSEFPNNAPKHPANGKSYAFDLPENYSDTVYLYFHIAGGITWDTGEVRLVDWEFCCDEKVTCIECEVPMLIAQIYDAKGNLVNEAKLDDGLYGLSASFADLDVGEYTVMLLNGSEKVAERKIEIVTDGETVSVEFELSLRCQCEPKVNKNENHSHD